MERFVGGWGSGAGVGEGKAVAFEFGWESHLGLSWVGCRVDGEEEVVVLSEIRYLCVVRGESVLFHPVQLTH